MSGTRSVEHSAAQRREPFARIGPVAWIGSAQFFIAQLVVQSAWTSPFSLTANYISDLGNTVCGPFPLGSANYVCSPWHAAMNGSFILTGASVVLGAALGASRFGRGWLVQSSLALITLAGAGFILVGLFPENVSLPPHRLGAALHFVCGNLGQLGLGIAWLKLQEAPGLASYSIASGVVGLAATALFVSGSYLGLGIGGMERLAAYPLPIWCIAAGLGLKVGAPPAARSRY